MNHKFVSGLILAAGASSRLGQPKQLLPYKGTTLLGWVVKQIESCKALDELIVVLGKNADDVRKQVQSTNSKIVINPGTEQGCSASYRKGIEAFNPHTEALVVLLGDQPGVDSGIVEKVVSFWQKDGSKIVLANYQGRKGHPMIISKDIFHLLLDLHGDKAVWKLVDQHPDWVREVAIDLPYPRDVNTWEDYQAILGVI
jgi:molybdenum cofactor cytidylyltransferase